MPLLTTTTILNGVSVNQSPNTDCYRLVHDGTKVISFFQSAGITSTKDTLFCGTEEECKNQIFNLGLQYDEFPSL